MILRIKKYIKRKKIKIYIYGSNELKKKSEHKDMGQ